MGTILNTLAPVLTEFRVNLMQYLKKSYDEKTLAGHVGGKRCPRQLYDKWTEVGAIN